MSEETKPPSTATATETKQNGPDDREPALERQAELEAAYEANVAAGKAPYAGVWIRTRGWLSWVMRERRWSGEVLWEGFERADLSRANLKEANLSGVDLIGANLSGADLNNATLNRARLGGANLSGANLGFANLSGADLHLADLSGAHLNGATLRGALLNSATLNRADLNGANLSGAALWGAIMDATTRLQDTHLDNHVSVLKNRHLSSLGSQSCLVGSWSAATV